MFFFSKLKAVFTPSNNSKYLLPAATLSKTKEMVSAEEESPQEEYEILEREIVPANIICPDCGGVTMEGLEYCDKCGGEILFP